MNENEELLQSFLVYCNSHPSERFWQALRNWSGHNYIMAANTKDIGHKDCQWVDTFYWKKRDGRL